MKKIILNLILLASVASSASKTFYSWDNMGQCLLKSKTGAIIKNESNLDKCRESEGSVYALDPMGYCHEMTPNGAFITGVIDDRFCRIKHF